MLFFGICESLIGTWQILASMTVNSLKQFASTEIAKKWLKIWYNYSFTTDHYLFFDSFRVIAF